MKDRMQNEKSHIDHALLMSYLLNEANDEQKNEVDNWLSLSEDNAAYLKSLEMLWVESGKLSPPPVNVDSSTAWNKVAEKLNFDSTSLSSEKKNTLFSIKPIWQAAAMIIVIFGAYGIFKLMTNVETVILSAGNKIITDTLRDGSIVSLNKNSTLNYPEKFEKHNRKVQLIGEAFFEVEHDEKQPFIIDVGGAFVKVLGTSFNVKEIAEEKSVQVYVQSGIVQLYSVNDERDTLSLILESGETGIIRTESGITEIPDDVGMNANEISWMNDTFVFDGVRLDYVAEFLESFYSIEIVFEKESYNELQLTASFKNDDIDDIMDVISGSFGLELIKENYTYYLNETDN
jgi:transmembrane sensor